MNFYEDGTPCGFGLVKVAGIGSLVTRGLQSAGRGLSTVGQQTAKVVGKAGKSLQNATAGGKFASTGHSVGQQMRNAGKWVNQGNNALKLGAGVVGAGALAAGGLAAGAASGMNGGNQQPAQQNGQQTW